jgi:hypothetical protein
MKSVRGDRNGVFSIIHSDYSSAEEFKDFAALVEESGFFPFPKVGAVTIKE